MYNNNIYRFTCFEIEYIVLRKEFSLFLCIPFVDPHIDISNVFSECISKIGKTQIKEN